MDFEENETIENKLLRMGAAITGSVAGAGVGLAVGGPIGALVGAVSSPIVTEVMGELSDYGARLLSVREQNKIGILAYIALSNIKTKLDKGCILRINIIDTHIINPIKSMPQIKSASTWRNRYYL